MTFFWQNPRDPGRDESPHYPFKRRAKLGPGPMGETNRRAAKWDCTTYKPYVYVCEGISEETEGQKRVVRVDPKRKEEYNTLYRKWVKKR